MNPIEDATIELLGEAGYNFGQYLELPPVVVEEAGEEDEDEV